MLMLPDPIDKLTEVRNMNHLEQLIAMFSKTSYASNGMRMNLQYQSVIITFLYYQKAYYYEVRRLNEKSEWLKKSTRKAEMLPALKKDIHRKNK